jgi:hypothetical protein
MQRIFLSCSGEYGSFPSSYSPHERSCARFSTAEGVYEPQALSKANASGAGDNQQGATAAAHNFLDGRAVAKFMEVLSYGRRHAGVRALAETSPGTDLMKLQEL